jgi:hypothetical protein
MAEMSDEQKKQAWERGKKVLERMMRYVPVEKLEKLADKIEDKSFRNSLQYKMFMNSLKD